MKLRILFLAVALIAAAAATGITKDTSLESLKTSNEEAFKEPSEKIAVTLGAGAENLSCDARLRRRGSGYHNRCPYRSVVTGVQIINDLAILTCAEVKVTCRKSAAAK